MNLIHEHFNSINELLEVLSNRPNNAIMKNENSSQKIDENEKWHGTRTWEEAIFLLRTGYTDILPEIKKEIKDQNNKYCQYTYDFKKRVVSSPVGYAPNVPNAIQNLPNSMIITNQTPIKKKTLSIIYCIGGTCIEKEKDFIKAGVSLLTAINVFERRGIQTQLSIGFMPTKSDDNREYTCPTLSIKNYNQKLNLQKLCFPIAHPAMFRRIGFKYLETCPQLSNESFAFGYGIPLRLKELITIFLDNDKNIKIINYEWIRDHNYEVTEIMNYLKKKEVS